MSFPKFYKMTTGGVFNGTNPFILDSSNPLALFIVQLVLIICTCKLIKLILSPIKQPSVIAEIIGGILLGPTVMGRIPNYMNIIFPSQSLPFLNLVSNFGLVMFLFLVGLELDPRMLKSGIKRSLAISIAGMTVPFSVGIAVSYALYSLVEPDDHKTSFVTFMLFLGVAMAITAFPVLARILTELHLLKTSVGRITISAAAIDDVTSWCLLALVISLIKAQSALILLYVILVGLGYVLVMIFVIRPLFIMFINWEGSYRKNKPSQTVLFVIFNMIFISAFTTNAIGIDAIFGGFVVGVIIPHDHGLAYYLTEKIEDIITILFLPLYFTLSGLKTQIGSLDTGTDWGIVFLVIFVACFGKIFGCTIAARLTKLSWRKSLTIGVLMNCKGLVELIVLNLGYDNNVISQKTFAIMIIMALVTTFMTLPLLQFIYPKKLQLLDNEERLEQLDKDNVENTKLLVCLNKTEHIASIMSFIQLFSNINDIKENSFSNSLSIYALRLLESTERSSSLILYNEENQKTSNFDPVLNVFRIFANLATSGIFQSIIKVCKPDDFATTISDTSEAVLPYLTIVPWNGNGAIIDDPSSPLEQVFQIHTKQLDKGKTQVRYANYVRDIYAKVSTTSNVSIFIDRGLGQRKNIDKNVFIPFFGGSDDHVALDIACSFAGQSNCEVTIVFYKVESLMENAEVSSNQDTIDVRFKGEVQIQFDQNLIDQLKKNDALVVKEVCSKEPINQLKEDVQNLSSKDLVLVGRSRNFVWSSLYGQNQDGVNLRIDTERRKVLGDVAEAILLSDSKVNLLVVQAKNIITQDI